MQYSDSIPSGPSAGRFVSNHQKPSINGEHNGFSHGGFHQTQGSIGGYGDRHPQRGNIPNINTGRLGQSMQSGGELQTPGTAFNMNFTPLLPSQLLLGSPFQPGSPNAFASPQFQSFSSFGQQNASNQQQNQQASMGSPIQQHQPLSPQLYQNMLSPQGMNATSFFGGPQSPTGTFGSLAGQTLGGLGGAMHMAPGLVSGTSRTVYLGNIPPETSAEEILGHVRSGQIESVRLLPDKNCAFISFLDSSSATHFHSDAILKKLAIRGQDIKIGWGKPSQVPTSVALAVQQSGASRNVYLGNLSEEVTEEELREDLGKFGPIDTVKIVREKAIGFVHFLSISNAMKAVAQLPQEPKWQAPRRVYYGKDRCAYVSKTQQQNAAQYLGIAPGYAHVLNGADRDLISNALAQQSVAAAAVATSAGGVNNLGNRTVYLGNIHPETTIEEICNVVRGGLLHHIRYIPDKHICFVTFIDPTSAASFYALSNLQGLMIHNRRLKIGWGKHSGALPPAIALAVSGGASRNVYIGNLDESWSEDRLRQDFSEYGEIELVNTLREKSCAFVNFTNIANAIKAIEAVRGREEYKRFKVNFAPAPAATSQYAGRHYFSAPDKRPAPEQLPPEFRVAKQHWRTRVHGQQLQRAVPIYERANAIQHSQQWRQQSTDDVSAASPEPAAARRHLIRPVPATATVPSPAAASVPAAAAATTTIPLHILRKPLPQAAFYAADATTSAPSYPSHPTHAPSSSFSLINGSSLSSSLMGSGISAATTIGGLLAPSNLNARAQHARAVSLPVFSQGPFTQPMHGGAFGGLGAGLGGFGGLSGVDGHAGHAGLGGGLPGWAEEEVGGQ
ncbi:hypothetical protein H2199_006517 [Coniosporium tulheliwenetii]|uniref:Uncharacterized protein n=1 Tax=Coniosporium tulheliwenetii TaxID=3383036 RepID=A0ACC2YWV0_9PEZI|nr:hypothetical protein H2199_006517 [Cladosporium sp. JES 115]